MENEIWKDMPGFEGIYEVSSIGRVATIKNGERFIRRLNKATGYLSVSRKQRPEDSSQTVAYVHQLIAEAFLGPRPEGHVVRHIDGNKLNNRASNLRYGTPDENIADSVSHGDYKGNSNGRAKFTEPGIRAVKMLLELGISTTKIAKATGTSIGTIHAIKMGRNWKDIR